MQNRNALLEIPVRRFVEGNRTAAVYPPRAPRLSASKQRWSDSTCKASAFFCIVTQTFLLMLPLPMFAAVREVASIGLTVDNLEQELNFFTNTLPFQLVSISEASGKEQEALLGLSAVKLRIATLQLGEDIITLTEHLSIKGRPIPK